MEEKMCPECGKPVFGRIDKKFCSDACRNAFNNKANSASTNPVTVQLHLATLAAIYKKAARTYSKQLASGVASKSGSCRIRT